MRAKMVMVVTVVVAGGLALGGCAGSIGSDDRASASCVGMLEYAGHQYLPRGPVYRDPPLGRRRVTAVRPGCDDTVVNGTRVAEPDVRVTAVPLAHVPVDVALAAGGGIYVRRGARLPRWAQAWFRPVRCTHRRTAVLTGTLFDLLGPGGSRYQGPDRPYLLRLHVTGGPATYRRTLIDVEADYATRTRLAVPAYAVRAAVACADGHFRARRVTTLRSPSGATPS